MNCPAFLDDFCLLKGEECKEELPCPIADDITKDELYEYLAEKYFELSKQKSEIENKLKILKSSLIKLGSGIYGKYEVKVTTFTTKRLDSNAAKKYLEELGVLNDFLKEIKSTRISVNPHISKN